MAISIDYPKAASLIEEAFLLSKEGGSLPVEWISYSQLVFGFKTKTYTTALATMLLAKSTNDQVDIMAIKVKGDKSYSMRGLAHRVVVPASVRLGFTLRTSGREPLNNQPWFRYDRIDEIDRVREKEEYTTFFEIACKVGHLSSEEAILGLASFLRVSGNVKKGVKDSPTDARGLGRRSLRAASGDFLRIDGGFRPARLQAFAAACLAMNYRNIQTRKLNDPSRDFPGDIQSTFGDVVTLAMEVRAKAMQPSDLDIFSASCFSVGIDRVAILVDSVDHVEFPRSSEIFKKVENRGQRLILFESALDLLDASLDFCDLPLTTAVSSFAKEYNIRLRDMGLPHEVVMEWGRAVSVARNS